MGENKLLSRSTPVPSHNGRLMSLPPEYLPDPITLTEITLVRNIGLDNTELACAWPWLKYHGPSPCKSSTGSESHLYS